MKKALGHSDLITHALLNHCQDWFSPESLHMIIITFIIIAHDNFFDNHDNSCDQDGYRPDGGKVIYDYKQADQSFTTCHDHNKHYDDHNNHYDDHHKHYDDHNNHYDNHHNHYDDHQNHYDDHHNRYGDHMKLNLNDHANKHTPQ